MTDNARIVREHALGQGLHPIYEARIEVALTALESDLAAYKRLAKELEGEDIKLRVALATAQAELARAREEERERWKKAVEDEPEFPGDIPDDLYTLLRQLAAADDRDAIAEALRIVVRLTKEGILARAALAPEQKGHPETTQPKG